MWKCGNWAMFAWELFSKMLKALKQLERFFGESDVCNQVETQLPLHTYTYMYISYCAAQSINANNVQWAENAVKPTTTTTLDQTTMRQTERNERAR